MSDWAKWLDVWSIFCLDVTKTFLDELGAIQVVTNHLEYLKETGREIVRDYYNDVLSTVSTDFQETASEKLIAKLSQNEIEELHLWIDATFVEVGSILETQSREWEDVLSEIKELCSTGSNSLKITARQEQVLCPLVLSHFAAKRVLRDKLNNLSEILSFSQDDQKYINIMDDIYSLILPQDRNRRFVDIYSNMIYMAGSIKSTDRVRSLMKTKLEESEIAEIIMWAHHNGFDVN